MISAALIGINLLVLQAGPLPGEGSELVIRRRVIIRVPTHTPPTTTPIHRWKEKKGDRCISGRGIAGAIMVTPRKVDFILPGGSRVRAELESSCPALDFYSGFYLRPDRGDQMICAGRDAIHARSGGECQIKRFRKLVPRPER